MKSIKRKVKKLKDGVEIAKEESNREILTVRD